MKEYNKIRKSVIKISFLILISIILFSIFSPFQGLSTKISIQPDKEQCLGAWQKVIGLTSRQDYELEIIPEDPGYAEIIEITGAMHLDENRSILEDVYSFVKARDKVWKEIPNEDHIRVTFEKDLTSQNDITIYARSNSSASIGVYEKNNETQIADFGTISTEKWYKIYLTNLSVSQDTFDLKVVNGSVEFDYIVDPDTPPNITYDGNYTVYTFKANGTFSPPAGVTTVSVLVVAGGGGGAAMTGGGGGAGGLIYNSSYAINGSNISVVVGGGGAGQVGSANPGYGSDGSNSTFGILIAKGGGGAGTNAAPYGRNGGSGGSCGHVSCIGGNGTAGQGNNGGSQTTGALNYGAGGGGGAGQTGFGGTNTVGGNGGNGLNYSINGSNVYYAGGGGGGTYSGGTLGTGGLGGGGSAPAGNATANTGGGGGGQRNNLANGGNGGSGIVIVRFLTYYNDTVYPTFSDYNDNSETLVDNGIGLFNVTVNNTNGTVLLEINNTNITATNLTANVYNASYNFTSSGVYIYRWHSWGNGTSHNYNESSDMSYIVNATVDNTPPIINLISPVDYANLSSIVSFNCTMSDVSGLKNSTLYGNWSGVWHANETQGVSGLINSTTFTKTIPDGKYIWNCYACDSLGNCGFNGANRTFTVDTVSPSISIIYPSNNSNFSYKNVSVNYTVSDNVWVQACWYTNSSGVENYSIANCANLITQIWSEGVNNVTIYANDSSGNVNFSSVSFRVDTTTPSISISYPQATYYYTDVLSLNYTSSEAGNCWYSNNSGAWNSTPIPAGTNFSNMTSIEGSNTWTVYCNDSLGNLNSTSVTFFKDTSFPGISFINLTPSSGTTTANTSVIVNVSISELSLQEVKYGWNGTNYSLYDSGLVLMMNFDNVSALGESATNVVDMSKYGNNGTPAGSAFVNMTGGKYGGGLQLDGTGDAVNLPEPPASSTNINTGTISAWIKTSNAGASYRGIVVKQNAYGMFLQDNIFGVYDWSTTTWRATGRNLADGNWHHVAVTFSSGVADGTVFYVDGVQNGTTIITISSQSEGVTIGSGDNPLNGQAFTGLIDEARIYNRSLSASEVYELYASNLNKFSQTQWYLYVNQSKNATAGLDEGLYTYQASATDTSSNTNQTEQRNITVDTTPPVITDVVNESITSSGARVNWTTNEAANGSVKYGTTLSMIDGSSNHSDFLLQHNVTLSSLTNSTSYYYNITSCDAYGNCNTTGPYNFTTLNSNIVPTIDRVSTVPVQMPIAETVTFVNINFTASDANGVGDLNDSTARAIFSRNGVVRSGNCTPNDSNATSTNYNCSVAMQYYDEAGTWAINVTVIDNSQLSAYNATTDFTYQELLYIQVSPVVFGFGDFYPGQANQPAVSNPLLIDNMGNVNLSQINITAYNLVNGSFTLGAGNITVNVSNAPGTALQNAVNVTVPYANVSVDADGVDANESLYFYISVPFIPALNYSSSNDWVITADK